MRRDRIQQIACLLLAAVLGALLSSALAETAKDERNRQWQLDQERFDLLDHEKALLIETDQLSLEIFDLKQKINDLLKVLSGKQSRMDKARHELITVQMKLIK